MAIRKGDGTIVLEVEVDQDGLVKGMNKMKGKVNSMKGSTDKAASSMAKLGKAAALLGVVAAIGKVAKGCIDLASDLEETQNVVDVAFGDMKYKIEEFAKTSIDKFGISETAAKKTASTFMAMGVGMGIASDSASDMAIKLTALSADMSSLYNISQETADVALKSVYTGETETLKRYGIVMTEVNLKEFARKKGIDANLAAMNQQDKTMLRYLYVLEQTKLAEGDFARNRDSWANQTRVLAQRTAQLKTEFGKLFMELGRHVLPVLQGLLTLFEGIEHIIAKITGMEETENEKTDKATEGTDKLTDSEKELEDQINSTAKANDRALASFDKINILGGIKGAAGGYKPIDWDKFFPKEDKAEDAAEKAISPFEKWVKRLLALIDKDAFQGLFDAFKKLGESISESFTALDQFLQKIGLGGTEGVIANTINTFVELLTHITDAFTDIFEAITALFQGDFESLGKHLLKAVAHILGALVGIINKALGGLLRFLGWEGGADALQTADDFFNKNQQNGKTEFENWLDNTKSYDVGIPEGLSPAVGPTIPTSPVVNGGVVPYGPPLPPNFRGGIETASAGGNGGGGGGNSTVILELDGRQLGEVTLDLINEEKQRRGVSIHS